jgi:hypothetical protein
MPTRSYINRPIEHRLEIADMIVDTHTENEAFRDGLTLVGVAPERITALSEAAAAARVADDAQAALYSTAREQYARVRATLAASERAYAEVQDRSHAAGRLDPDLKAALDFGPKEQNRTKRLAQKRQFLEAATTHQADLAPYGLTADHLTAAKDARDTAHQTSQEWTRRNVDAQDATQQRDALMVPLDAIVRDLQERGRIAFRDQPQFLEFLGLGPL